MAAIDINRGTAGINLPTEISNEIWSKTQEESAIMRLARPMELPGAGVEVDIITGDPEAAWVSGTDETAERSVSKGAAGSKKIKPYTLSVIVPFSRKFARDKARLYDEMVARIPGALAAKYDGTVFGSVTKPGENFDQLKDCTAVDIKADPWAGLVAADAAIAENGGICNGFAIAPKAKSLLLTAVDGNKRPLFVNSTAQGGVPAVLGNPTYVHRKAYLAGQNPSTPETIGFAGDWNDAVYGIVEGMLLSVSDQATLKINGEQVNLWQRDMFAIRVEIEAGFAVKDAKNFIRLTGEIPGA